MHDTDLISPSSSVSITLCTFFVYTSLFPNERKHDRLGLNEFGIMLIFDQRVLVLTGYPSSLLLLSFMNMLMNKQAPCMEC